MTWPIVTLDDLQSDEPRAITDGPFGSNCQPRDNAYAHSCRRRERRRRPASDAKDVHELERFDGERRPLSRSSEAIAWSSRAMARRVTWPRAQSGDRARPRMSVHQNRPASVSRPAPRARRAIPRSLALNSPAISGRLVASSPSIDESACTSTQVSDAQADPGARSASRRAAPHRRPPRRPPLPPRRRRTSTSRRSATWQRADADLLASALDAQCGAEARRSRDSRSTASRKAGKSVGAANASGARTSGRHHCQRDGRDRVRPSANTKRHRRAADVERFLARAR